MSCLTRRRRNYTTPRYRRMPEPPTRIANSACVLASLHRELFLAVVEKRSISRAAKREHLTGPAISKRVATPRIGHGWRCARGLPFVGMRMECRGEYKCSIRHHQEPAPCRYASTLRKASNFDSCGLSGKTHKPLLELTCAGARTMITNPFRPITMRARAHHCSARTVPDQEDP